MLGLGEPRPYGGATSAAPSEPILLVRPRETAEEGALRAALRWLALHASADGMWTTRPCRRCGPYPEDPGFDVGRTGLALLAFFGAGHTDRSSESPDGVAFGDVVRRALQALAARQGADGAVGPADGAKFLLNHILATLAFCEGYRLTRSPRLERPARRAVEFLLSARNPGGGWRYAPGRGDNDSIVTGWAVLALRSAEEAGIEVCPSAYAGAFAWFDRVTEEAYGRVGYASRFTKCSFVATPEPFDAHESSTAMSLVARGVTHPVAPELLLRDPPQRQPTSLDYLYWHVAARALLKVGKPAAPRLARGWDAWWEALSEAVLGAQRLGPDAPCPGSWEAADRWSREGGRVYATAINALTLELLVRSPAVFDARR